MKILHLTDLFHPNLGGMESHVSELVLKRAELGHDITVVTLTPCDHEPQSLVDAGIDIRRIGAGFTKLEGAWGDLARPYHPPLPDPVVARNLRRIIDEVQPDIVHAHNWIVYSYLAIKRPTDPPVLWMQHDYSLECPKKTRWFSDTAKPCPGSSLRACVPCSTTQYGALKGGAITLGLRASNRLLLGKVERVLANSASVAAGALEVLPRTMNLEVLGGFINTEDAVYAASLERPHFLPADNGFILFVGTLGEHKGIKELVAAYAGLDRNNTPALVILGVPRPDQSMTFPEGVTVVENVGHPEVLASFRHCSFAVVPSLWPEPFGRVVLEAAAFSKAVVASRVGGLGELVVDGETGLLVEAGDVAGLTAAMQRLVDSPSYAAMLGEKAKIAGEPMNITEVARRLDEISAEIIAEHSAKLMH